MIGLTSIFTLRVSRFSMTALCRCFKSPLVFQGKSRFHGNSCHSCYAAEISRTCQLRELWKSSALWILLHAFWTHTRICRCIFLHSACFCTFLLHLAFYIFLSSTFLHFCMFITMLNTYIDYCFNAVATFHKHLSSTGRVKSISSGVKEQLTILDQVVN